MSARTAFDLSGARRVAVARLKAWLKSLGRRWLAGPVRPGIAPSHWGLAYVDGRLSLGGLALDALTATHGSPLHVIDAQKLLDNLKAFQTAPPGCKTGLDVFYSYKTNPLPWVFETLYQASAGAEVISEYELWLALKLGVPPHRIVYNGPAKSEASLEEAIRQNILSIHVNHLEELELIAQLAARQGRRARIGLRVTSTTGWTGQFGFPVEDGSALRAFEKALSLPEVEVVALHSHRGVLIRDADALGRYLDFLLRLVDTLRERFQWVPQVLDVGGSLAIPSTEPLNDKVQRQAQRYLVPSPPPDPAKTLSPQAYATQVVQRVHAHFDGLGLPVPQLLAEPGRALTGNAQYLLTTVQQRRRDQGFDYLVMDAGVSVASIVRGEYHELLPLKAPGAGPLQCYRVVGPICHMGDTLFPAKYLPELQPGDQLAIMDSGAYFIADASSFSFAQPGVVAIDSKGQVHPVRDKESFAHLVSLDHFAAK